MTEKDEKDKKGLTRTNEEWWEVWEWMIKDWDMKVMREEKGKYGIEEEEQKTSEEKWRLVRREMEDKMNDVIPPRQALCLRMAYRVMIA